VKQLLTTNELADQYGIEKSLQKRLREGRRLPYVKLGHRSIKYRRTDVEAFIDACHVPAGEVA
jgi:excisionase family DNA binding protein